MRKRHAALCSEGIQIIGLLRPSSIAVNRPRGQQSRPVLRCSVAIRVAAAVMGKRAFRLVFLHDLTYAVEFMMADGTEKLVKGFASEAAAEAWVAEQRRLAPKGEVWTRRLKLSWRS